MANVTFDDLIPKGGDKLAGAATPQSGVSFDDLVPQTQGPPVPEGHKPSNDRGALDASNLGVRQGVTFGFGDEIMAGMLTPVEMLKRAITKEDEGKSVWDRVSGAYDHNLTRERADLKTAQEQHPIASTTGEVMGGMALGGQAAKGGATLLKGSPTYPSMIGRGAAEGAIYGAGYGFGNAEGGVENRVKEAGVGGAVGAVTGGAMGAVGARMANTNAMKDVPDSEGLKALASQNYKRAEQAGLRLAPKSWDKAISDIQQAAVNNGFDPDVHQGAAFALKYLEKKHGQPVSLEELDVIRQTVRDAGKSAKDGRIVGFMQKELDGYINNLSPTDVTAGDINQGVNALKTARDLWSRGKKGEVLERALEQAENKRSLFTASGYENALRDRFRNVANNEKFMRQFSDEEQASIRRVARGGPIENIARGIGRFAPRGPVGMGAGAGVGYTIAGPVGPPIMWGLGEAGRQVATGMTSRNARAAEALIKSGGNLPPARLTSAQRALLDLAIRESAQGGAALTGP